MNLSISSSSVTSTSAVRGVSALSSLTTSAAGVAGEATGDSSDVSGPAALMNKLKTLQASDPEKFKEATSAISKKLTEQASSTTDEHQKKMLTDLASKFEQASETGDMSSLQPPQPPPGVSGSGKAEGDGPKGPPPAGGGGHGGGGGASAAGSSSSSSSTSTDPADTNGDGKVSEAERAAYAAKKAATEGADPADAQRAAGAYKRVQGDGADFMKQVDGTISSVLSQFTS